MKSCRFSQLLVIAVVLILVPTPLDAIRRKPKLKIRVSTESTAQSRPGSPTNAAPTTPVGPNPGSSGSMFGKKPVNPKKSPSLLSSPPGTYRPLDPHKHHDSSALGRNSGRNDPGAGSSSSFQQKPSILSSETQSILSNNPFAKIPGSDKPRRRGNQPKQHEELPSSPGSNLAKTPSNQPNFPSLEHFRSKLPLDRSDSSPVSSQQGGTPRGKFPKSSARKLSLQELGTLSSSGTAQNFGNRPSMASMLTPATQDLSPGQFPSLSGKSGNPFGAPWMPQSASQFNSPLNSPLDRNRGFFRDPSSSMTSISGGIGSSFSSGSLSSFGSGSHSPSLNRNNNPSNAPPVTKPVRVSQKTCKDDTSPAEQCFNYFTFSVFWPPAMGYEYKLARKEVNSNINVQKWLIHGLYPTAHHGMVPENCARTRISASFSQYRIYDDRSIREGLWSKWITVCPYTDRVTSMVSFWDRQFAKHGLCASRSRLIGSDVGYFKKALTLYDDINIAGILMSINFKPGTSMIFGDLEKKVNQKVGRKVRMTYVMNQVTKVLYLKEIKFCYDLQFNLQDCRFKPSSEVEHRELEMIYLNDVPAIEKPADHVNVS